MVIVTATTRRTALIVDDEAPARARLERLVSDIEGWSTAGSCASGAEALERISCDRPDVVLLDIEMPGMNGLEVAKRLAELEAPPAVVFTTAYDQFALEAFDSRAAAYVVKPVRRERLEAALEHAARVADGLGGRARATDAPAPRRQLAIRVRDELRIVQLKDVRYFQADQKYTIVHHVDGADLIEESLRQLEQEFGETFVRIHRSMLVASAQVARLERLDDGGCLVVMRATGERLPVSRRQIAELKTRLAGRR